VYLAHLAIAVRDLSSAELLPVAAAIVVIVQPEESGFSLVEWEESPWRGEGYLGLMLTPDQVRAIAIPSSTSRSMWCESYPRCKPTSPEPGSPARRRPSEIGRSDEPSRSVLDDG